MDLAYLVMPDQLLRSEDRFGAPQTARARSRFTFFGALGRSRGISQSTNSGRENAKFYSVKVTGMMTDQHTSVWGLSQQDHDTQNENMPRQEPIEEAAGLTIDL